MDSNPHEMFPDAMFPVALNDEEQSRESPAAAPNFAVEPRTMHEQDLPVSTECANYGDLDPSLFPFGNAALDALEALSSEGNDVK